MKTAIVVSSLLLAHALPILAATPVVQLTDASSRFSLGEITPRNWWSCFATGKRGVQSDMVVGFGFSREEAANNALKRCRESPYSENCTIQSCRHGL